MTKVEMTLIKNLSSKFICMGPYWANDIVRKNTLGIQNIIMSIKNKYPCIISSILVCMFSIFYIVCFNKHAFHT